MIARFHRMHKSRADIQFLTTDKGIIKSGGNSIFATRTGPHCSRRAVSGGASRTRIPRATEAVRPHVARDGKLHAPSSQRRAQVGAKPPRTSRCLARYEATALTWTMR